MTKKKRWFDEKTKKISSMGGYKRPELYADAVRLDSNENYLIPKQFQNNVISSARKNSDIRQYPLGGAEQLIQSLSKFLRMSPQMIGVGNGSDQILDLILSNFASKNTRILTSDPTFAFFEERCKLYSIPLVAVPFLNDMKLDITEFERRSKDADILYIDSPNNPTGFQFARNKLRRLVKSFEGLVIIDEAYKEFADYSLASMVKTQDNLIVVQTFSKSFGLAGLRLGYFMANEKFTDAFMNVVQYPYPLGSITIESGIQALEKFGVINNAAGAVKTERKRIISTLQRYEAFEVFDSKANFVLFDAHGAYKRIYTALAEQGIIIRKLGRIGEHDGCLRVTVGTKEMNSKFLLAIRDLLE